MEAAKIAVRIKGQTTCFHHKGRQLELYCEQCHVLACVKCVSGIHKGHSLCDIDEITRQKEQEIRNFVDKTEQKELVECGKYITSTNTLLIENDRTFEILANQLREQNERLKQDLDMLTAETLSLYQKMKDDNNKLIQKYTQDLVVYSKQLKQQMRECKKVLQQGSHIEIFDTECEIDSLLHLPVKPVLGTVSFTPNRNPRKYLQLALGTCKSVNPSTLEVKDRSVSLSHGQGQSSTQQKSGGIMINLLTEAKVLEQWESPYGMDAICPTTDDHAWAKYGNTIILLNRKGAVIQVVKQKAGINDISISPTTHRLWACDGDNNVLELESEQLSKRFRTKDKPECICVTADNHIIIGMSNTITKYTTRGRKVLTTEVPGTATPLVCTPYRITVCPITNNVAVIDHSSERDGGDGDKRVFVMDTHFRQLFMYRGDIPRRYKQTSQTRGKPFNPWDIVYDSQGDMIISNNDKIHILSCNGEVLRILDTYSIRKVYAVSVSRQGLLLTVSTDDIKLLQYCE